MSTSDQNGKAPLTRKQLREIRLTGSTPVITEEQAAAPTPPPVPPAPVLPRAAEPAPVAPAPVADSSVDLAASPLTRRQARAQERIRTASVPVIASPAVEEHEEAAPEPEATEIVSGVPAFAPRSAAPAVEDVQPKHETFAVPDADEADSDKGDDLEDLLADTADEPGAQTSDEAADDVHEDNDADEPAESAEDAADESEPDIADLGVDVDAIEDIDDDADEAPRATVNSAFGNGVLAEDSSVPTFSPSFDELVGSGDSAGSQHSAPSALIFTPSPGDGSLSGPVASTGEMLITGTYELPEGLGSQGHAKGMADGKDVDAVLIDGELPPASSPTPIAASSAVSTIKPAGEVIRPPAPEKGNKLMLTLAITAGGLALALAAALIIAFTMNVF